jgi:hypothetical protein
MEKILLSPPIAFIILLGISLLLSFISKFIAAKGIIAAGKEKSDYNQFFPFAFFFTIMHVVVLIVATVPKEISIMPFLYLLVAVMALFILFRK